LWIEAFIYGFILFSFCLSLLTAFSMLFSSSSITSESVLKSVFVLHVVVDARDVVAVKHVAILARFVGGTPLKLALLVFPAASPPSFTTRMIRPTMSLPPK